LPCTVHFRVWVAVFLICPVFVHVAPAFTTAPEA
jgi:hypothetical protein